MPMGHDKSAPTADSLIRWDALIHFLTFIIGAYRGLQSSVLEEDRGYAKVEPIRFLGNCQVHLNLA